MLKNASHNRFNRANQIWASKMQNKTRANTLGSFENRINRHSSTKLIVHDREKSIEKKPEKMEHYFATTEKK
jgi:hypothetical protein